MVLPTYTYTGKHFTIELFWHAEKTNFTMSVPTLFSTEFLPETYKFIKSHYPDVLKTKCFNPKHLPFASEVKNTQLAHLWEHLFLDILVKDKAKLMGGKISHSGVTSWDWHKNPRGTFDVTIDIPMHQWPLVEHAFTKATQIIEALIAYHEEKKN